MSRKNKIDPAEKVKIIERVLADEISATEAARLIGVDRQCLWIIQQECSQLSLLETVYI